MHRVLGRCMFGFGTNNNNNIVQRFRLYSTSTSCDAFAEYLVTSLGFSHQQAIPVSTRLSHRKKLYDFKFQANATCVVSFFKHHGFDDTHLRKIVSSAPRLLCSNVDKTLEPKLLFLQDQGFSGSDLVRVVSVNPNLFLRRVESYILPAVLVLRQLLVSDTLVVAVFKKLHWLSFNAVIKHLLPNVALLTSYGIPIESIRKHLLMHPSPFLFNSDIFKDKVTRVEKKLELTPSRLLYGIKLVCCLTEETIESKCRIFKSFGWTQTDVQTFIIKNAHCFTSSDESINKKLDFLMNELRLTPAYLTSNSIFLNLSLEKTIVPRHKVLLILKEKGLLKKNPSLSVICTSESRFLTRFVLPFKEVHQVYAKLTGRDMKIATRDSAYDLE